MSEEMAVEVETINVNVFENEDEDYIDDLVPVYHNLSVSVNELLEEEDVEHEKEVAREEAKEGGRTSDSSGVISVVDSQDMGSCE